MVPVKDKHRLQRNLEAVPEDHIMHKKMGDVYFAEQNFFAAAEEYKQAYISGGRHFSANIILKFQRAILNHPDNMSLRLAFVEYHLGENNYLEAVEELEELLEVDPANIKALEKFSKMLIHVKDEERIVPILENAVDNALFDPALIDLLISRYLKEGKIGKAISVYERLLAEKPNNENILQNLIELNIKENDLRAAAKYGQVLLEKHPGLSGKIAAQFEQELINKKENKEIFYLLAKAFIKDLKPEKAVLYYEKILKTYPEEENDLIGVLKELLHTFPDFPEAQLLFARIYIDQEKYSEAVALFNKVVRSDPMRYGEEVIQGYQFILQRCPNQALAIQSLGEIYLAKKEYALAVDQFRILLSLSQDTAEFVVQKCKKILKVQNFAAARHLIGEAYLMRKNYNKALEEAHQLIKSSPDYGGGYEINGKALLAMGRKEQAVEQLRTALGLNPYEQSVQAAYAEVMRERLLHQVKALKEQIVNDTWKLSLHFFLGKTYFLLGDQQEAVPELQLAVKDVARAKDAYTLLGLAFKEQGRFDLASLQFQQALNVSEKYIKRDERLKLNLYRAFAEESFGKPAKALEFLEKVAIEDSRFHNVTAHIERISKVPDVEGRGKILLGILPKENGQKLIFSWVPNQEMVGANEKRIHSPVSFSLDHNNRGVENALKGRIGEAKKDLNLAISLDKNLTAAYNNLALLSLQEKNYEEAEFFINKALFINPKLAILFATKGLMCQLKGELTAAEKNYNEALSLDDGLQGVQLNLGDILYQNKKVADAMVYWQRALELSSLPELAQRRLIWKQAG